MRLRLTMFVLGSAIGAFAGALSVHGNGYAQPTDYTVELGLGIFVMLIVGGIDSLWGPVLGAAFYVWLPHFLSASISRCSAIRSVSTTRSSTALGCC